MIFFFTQLWIMLIQFIGVLDKYKYHLIIGFGRTKFYSTGYNTKKLPSELQLNITSILKLYKIIIQYII